MAGAVADVTFPCKCLTGHCLAKFGAEQLLEIRQELVKNFADQEERVAQYVKMRAEV